MAVNANFGLAGPAPNFGNALQTGFQQGRQIAQQRNSDNALAAYQANPNDPGALNALTIADPARGTAIMQAQTMQQATADKAAQRTAVMGMAPDASGNYAPGAGLKYAQATGDINGGMALEKFSAGARKEHLDAIGAAATAVATVGVGAKSITNADPAVQLQMRQAYAQSQAPFLLAHGITADKIAGQDWTDQGIDQTTSNALGLKGALERSDSVDSDALDQAKADETVRHNKATEGNARGNLAVRQGALGLANQRYQSKASAPGNSPVAPLSGVSDSDLLSLATEH